MKLEKGVVPNQHLMFMVIAFMQSMALTSNFSISITKQDTWIAALVSYAIALLFALLYLAIAKSYPDKNLIQINDAVFGPYVGKLISAWYLWFFFQLAIHYMYFFNSFWITYIMPETPRSTFLIMLGVVCAMAVRKGVEVIARCCLLFAVTVWITTAVLALLLVGDMKLEYLQPVLQVLPKDFVQSVHVMLTIPFCDIVVFLMLFPYTADTSKLKKPFLIGLSVSTLQLLLVVFRDILTLGPRIQIASSASFIAARQIDIASVLTRLDILVAVALLITVFVKVTVHYYAVVLGTAQILKLRTYQPLTIPIGILMVTVGIVLYPTDMEQAHAAKYAWPFNASVSEFILPLVTAVAILIRKLVEKRKELKAQ